MYKSSHYAVPYSVVGRLIFFDFSGREGYSQMFEWEWPGLMLGEPREMIEANASHDKTL